MEVVECGAFGLDVEAVMLGLCIEEGSEDAKDFYEFVEEVRRIVRPKAVYDVCYVEDKTGDTVTIGGVRFSSKALRGRLGEVERVFPFIATCGRELDGMDIAADDFVKGYWLDTVKAIALGWGIRHLNDFLKRKYALGKSSSMSPGAADEDIWPIEQQRELFALFPDAEEMIGVRLTESCLMLPNKSVSGIRFPTEIEFESCQLCRRENCSSRRAPFDENMRESLS